jgi:hypothetical protein
VPQIPVHVKTLVVYTCMTTKFESFVLDYARTLEPTKTIAARRAYIPADLPTRIISQLRIESRATPRYLSIKLNCPVGWISKILYDLRNYGSGGAVVPRSLRVERGEGRAGRRAYLIRGRRGLGADDCQRQPLGSPRRRRQCGHAVMTVPALPSRILFMWDSCLVLEG